MKYINAADVLPEDLIREISQYVKGGLLYIPILEEKSSWGERSGAKAFFQERNQEICKQFQQGKCIDILAETFGLSQESIRKIVGKSKSFK